MGGWTLEPEPRLDGWAVEWAEPGELLLAKGSRLYRSAGPGATPHLVADFPAPLWRRRAARVRPLQRLLRQLYYNVVKRPDGEFFLTYDKSLARLTPRGVKRVEGMAHPFRVLRSACAVDGEGCVWLGEYFGNPERGEVRVYRLPLGAECLEVAHRFPAGTVRHVHGIYRDPYAGGLWCLTGDRAGECQVAVSRNGFRSLERVGGGDETWRTVSVLFTEKGVYYGSDAEFDRNHLYRIDRRTGHRDVLAEIDGPVYYSHAEGRHLFFAVTAELCPSQVGRHASLWWIDTSTDEVRRIARFEKDALPVKYFLPGTLQFARGPGVEGGFYLHGVAVRGAEDRTFFVRLSEPAARRSST